MSIQHRQPLLFQDLDGRLADHVSRGIHQNVNPSQVLQHNVTQRINRLTIMYVRGMNQRYNITYLNGNLAPATEVYSRAFAYDLLPSPIIDRILIYKSPSPDLLGDFAGGAVKVFTKNAKPVRPIDI